MKVKELIEKILVKTGAERLPEGQTCDLLVAGNEEAEVTKIVSTFMATVAVIQQAIDVGANLIITHEPTWYTGPDEVNWLAQDPVYLAKKKLIEDHQLNIWRFHDHMHMATEDLIYTGLDKELDWAQYVVRNEGELATFGQTYELPKCSLRELSAELKEKLGMDVIQIVGNPEMTVERVGVLVGGGSLGLGVESLPMELMERQQLDLVICGDITEWTLSAYINDASALGLNKGMLVLGHERSEEMGMKHLVPWLEEIGPGCEVVFIDAKEPFVYL